MRSNRVEEASAVAERIGKAIVKANRKELNDLDPRHGTQNLWRRVNKLIHKPRGQDQTSQVSAEDLNTHYDAISTDPAYVAPPLRQTAVCSEDFFPSFAVTATIYEHGPMSTNYHRRTKEILYHDFCTI